MLFQFLKRKLSKEYLLSTLLFMSQACAGCSKISNMCLKPDSSSCILSWSNNLQQRHLERVDCCLRSLQWLEVRTALIRLTAFHLPPPPSPRTALQWTGYSAHFPMLLLWFGDYVMHLQFLSFQFSEWFYHSLVAQDKHCQLFEILVFKFNMKPVSVFRGV